MWVGTQNNGVKEVSLNGHTHSASNITSGTINAARLPSSVSNNIEVATYIGVGAYNTYNRVTFSKAIRVAINLGNKPYTRSTFYSNVTYMADLPTSPPSDSDLTYGWNSSGKESYVYRSSDNKTIYFKTTYDAEDAFDVAGRLYFVIGIY